MGRKSLKAILATLDHFLWDLYMELRVGTVGFRVPSLPIFLIVGTTQNLKRLPNGSRSKETVNNKTKMQSESFLYLFFSKNGI